EGGRRHRPSLVRHRDREQLGLQVERLAPDQVEQLGARPAQRARGHGDAAGAEEGLHLTADRLEVERGVDQGVVEVEDADRGSGGYATGSGVRASRARSKSEWVRMPTSRPSWTTRASWAERSSRWRAASASGVVAARTRAGSTARSTVSRARASCSSWRESVVASDGVKASSRSWRTTPTIVPRSTTGRWAIPLSRARRR